MTMSVTVGTSQLDPTPFSQRLIWFRILANDHAHFLCTSVEEMSKARWLLTPGKPLSHAEKI